AQAAGSCTEAAKFGDGQKHDQAVQMGSFDW
ncbi:MAG: hypothetical protein QOF42_1302, partial [Gammaproteobacteria bacterium]|nr:hypothetical protein [Gammaproteobacteria bacterium]